MYSNLYSDPNGSFVRVPQIMAATNSGRALVMRVAQEAGAIIRIGKVVLIDREKYLEFVREHYGTEA